jgi:SnoaL-like domain
MSQTKQERNKALSLEAFNTLFNKRDYVAAERYWSPRYIQHSAHIAPGREDLFELVKAAPPTLKSEPGLVVADGDYVILHGRFSGFGLPVNWVGALPSRHRGFRFSGFFVTRFRRSGQRRELGNYTPGR